jgi:hypothetical protein
MKLNSDILIPINVLICIMIYSNNFDKFKKIMAIQNFISIPFLLQKQFTILQRNIIS